MKPGYIYVLVHPSDPLLVKIGRTTRKPEERLVEHNSNYEELTGRIVKETGQKWELKEYIAVPDPAWTEAVLWEVIHRFGNEEVYRLEWSQVQTLLDTARKAGVRPPPKPRSTPVRNREWMIKQLEGTGITMIGHYRGLVTGVEFQCAKGHVFKESAGLVAREKYCPWCRLEEDDTALEQYMVRRQPRSRD